MRKILAMILAAGFCLGAAACAVTDSNESGEESTNTVSSESQSEETPLSESEIKQMYTDPEKFIDRTVTLTGKVFSTPEIDES